MKRTLLTLIAAAAITCPLYGQEVSVNVPGRSVNGSLPLPSVECFVDGVVVVQVKVDWYGDVTEATPGASGTTITDETVWNSTRNAALKAHFNTDSNSPLIQEGTITYTFSTECRPMTVKEIVESSGRGWARVKGRYVETYDRSKLIFGLEDEDYVIPVQLVKKDLGAENRFRALNLKKGDLLTVEGRIANVQVKVTERYIGLSDAVIVERKDGPLHHEALPYEFLEEKPSFNGGDTNEFTKWINSQLKYPKSAKDNGIQGMIVLSFIVKADGSVANVRILRGIDPALDDEAVRVVSSSPKWKPGTFEGKPVDVTFTFPVMFCLR